MSRAVAEANYRKKQEEERKRKQAEEQKQASASSRQRTENRQAARQTLADRNRGTQQRATEAYINRTNTQKQSTFFDRDTASTYKANRNNKRDNNWNQNKTRNQFLERDTANFETKKAPQGSQTHRNVPTESQTSSVHGGGGGGFKESSTAEKIARKTGKVVDETLRNTVTSDLITATDIGQENKWRQRSVDVNANNENIQPLQKDVERAKKAGEDYQKLLKKRDESDKRLDELTKDAKGIEKAWYGAVEAGTGMGLDLAFGPAALAHMATRTYGSTRGKAQAQGATEAEDRLYSFAQAGKEVGTELIFPGAGIAKKVVGGRGLKIADRAVNALTKNLSGRKADIIGAGARLLAGTGEENIEEALGWGLDPIIEEYTYARNARKRENQALLQDQRSALLDSITDENSARSASLYLSSAKYRTSIAQEYEKAGVPKDKAIELARKNAKYLRATLVGDTETASALEDEIASELSSNHQMEWDKGELLETFGSTTMLTLLTGAGGAVSEARAGNAIKSQLGEEGTKELVELAKGFEDNELSIKAQVASDRLQEGKDITAIQAVELQRGAMEQVAKLADRKTASDRTAERQIERNEYVAPCARDDRGNLVMDDATEQAYQEAQESALKSITAKDTLSKKQSTAGANAIAGFETGVFTVDNALELGYGNDTVREAFREQTGIDLDQYIVRDKNGNVDIPQTNAATYDALFAMSADNLVKSAERSTQVWIDKGRGEFSSTITQRMNADGVTAFREVMQDSDPRNRDEYVLKANVADLMYQQGKNLGLEWDEVKGYANDIAPNFDEGMLEKMYEAGRFDREKEMDIARDEELVIGQALEAKGMGRKPVKGNLSVEIQNPENTPEDSVIGAFASIASSLGVDIHLVDSIQSQDGTEVYTNGYYTPDGDIVIHVASGGETNVGFIFMHEATHHLKKYAPTQYRELVDLVRQKWFSKDSEGMKKRINDTIALYAAAGETLTEDQALEEIIANSAHEFLTDRNFAKEVAEENPELAKSLISAIKHVLRKLRQAIAGSYTNDTYMDSLFSELGILSEAERLWMNAYKAAVENKSAVGLVEWEKETSKSLTKNTEQEISSRDTSINSSKVPAVFNKVNWKSGTVNLDIGGGRFDNVADYLSPMGVENLVYDPYNRSKEHNDSVNARIEEQKADTATISNVLNVIKEKDARIEVLENAKENVKPGGEVYITVYEGNGSGVGAETTKGYQLNQKLKDYLPEVIEVFPNAYIKKGMIVAPNSGVTEEAKAELENHGATVTPGGSVVRQSLTSWKATDVETLKEKLVESGFSEEEVDNWIDNVNSIAALIETDTERLDYDADPFQVALKPNSEYYYTLDLSTLCAKRRLFQGTFNAIMHRLGNYAFTSNDGIKLRKMMDDLGYQVPCGICYEESRKKNEGKFAKIWLNGETEHAFSVRVKAYEKKLAEYEALEDKGKKRPPKKPVWYKGYANTEHADPYIPSLDEVLTTDGRNKLRKEGHGEVVDDYVEYMKGRGSANPKISFTHTDYRGDILNLTDGDIKKVKHIGGLRIQSFSDFEIPHVIDMMQAVMDMSARNLTAQAYTKVPAFADIFGGSGIKINLSLIGKIDQNTGKLVFDAKEGIDPAEAFRLREKYSKNVGTIIVGANDASILKAWANPRIDMVIPFHRSGWSKAEFKKLGLGDYQDYQAVQSEHFYDEEQGKWISLAKAKKEAIYSEDYWDATKSGKENAEAYLKLCAEKHFRPVFYNFLHDNGDGTWSLPTKEADGYTADGYWKSLIDYKMYDNEGNSAPQQEVKPVFDMEAAQFYMSKNNYNEDPDTLPVAQDVVDGFVAEIEKKHKKSGIRRSVTSQIDSDELARIKAKKRTNKQDRQILRDAGEKLKESDFYALYSAHKLDLRGNGNVEEQVESIKNDGFYGDAGFGYNVVPASINNISRYTADERRQYLKEVGLSDDQIEESVQRLRENPGHGMWSDDTYFPRINVTALRYGGRKGDTVLLVPEHHVYKDERVINGFKPFDYEVVKVERDFQPYYELYSTAYDEYQDDISSGVRRSITPKDQVMEQISDEAKTTDDVPMEDAYDEEGRQRYARSKDDFFNNMNTKWQERWKTEGKVLRTESIEKDVRQIVLNAMLNSDTSARYKTDMVKQTVQACRQAYRYLKEDKYDDAWDILYENALDMVENLEFVEDNLFKQYNPLRNYLRTTAFVVSEEYWQDEDFKDFVKRNRGRILIKHGEMSNVDSKFEELAEMYPEFFNSEAITHMEDQLAHIEDVLDKLQPYTWAYNSEEAMDLAQSLASNLADLILTHGEEYKSLADKYNERYDAQTKAMKVRHQEAINNIKQRAETEIAELKGKLSQQKETYKQNLKEQQGNTDWMIAWLKQNRDISIAWAVHNEKQKQIAKREKEKQKQKERAIQKRQFRDIQESVGWLSEALLRPTKEQNIPEGFRAALARVLATIDLQTERSKKLEAKYGKVAKKTLALGRLRDEYKRISLSKDAVYNPRSYLVNEDNYGLMDDLALNCDGRSIDELNAEELESVDTMLKVLVNDFKSANEIRKAKKKATAMETASQGIADFKRTIKKRKKRGLKEYKGLRGGLDSILNYNELTPVYFFSRLGGTMQNMYGMLRDGFDTYVKNLAQINEDLSNIMYPYSKHGRFGGTTIKDWRNSKTAEAIPLTNGGQVVLSAAQRMSIYCLAQRNQALVHMVYGGIRINPIQPGSKAEAFKERVGGVKPDRGAYTLSYEDIENIIAKLTPEQKKVADDLQMYMANQMAEMGNKTSLEDLGIKVFKDKNYFPIHVSGENLETRIDKVDAIVNWISNPGFMKALMPNSKKPIDIDDIFTVTAQHCNSMNLYASYAVPLADFMKVFNAEVVNADGTKTSFKEELIKAHGDKALTYVTNFLKDINGSMTKRKGGEVLESLIGKAKKAAVFANIRVLLQQPMSLFRSWQLINPKYFGVIPWTPSSMREMIDNCPIAQWKSWGYYDTHFGRDIEDVLMNVKPGLMDIVGGGLYGYADLATWTYIWNAVKAEQRDYFERRKRRGTDYTEEEFLQACSERASEVFDKTQVVDSLFHRSDWMRSDQVYIKQLTSFQAEPTVSFNMLRAGLVEMADAWRDGNKAKAMEVFARTTSTYLLNAAAVGAMAAIVDVFRGKGQADDDDEQLTAKDLWFKNFMDNFAQNALVWYNIYIVKDTIVPAMDGVLGYIKDGNWYAGLSNNIAFQGFKNIQSGLKKAWNIYTKGEDSNYNALDVMQEVAGGLGYLYGIPARTVIRDSRRLWNLFAENAYAADPYTFTVTLNNGQEVVTNDYREHIKQVAQYTESGEMRSQSVTQPEGSAAREFFTGLGYEDKSINGYNDPTKTEETDERFGFIQAFDSFVDGLGAKYRENKAAEKEAEKEEKKKLKDAKKLVNGETSKRKPAFADLSDSEKIDRLNEDLEGVTGEKRSKKIWDKINDGYGDKVEEGDYAYVRRMRAIMEGAGGDLEFFDEKILDKSKTAFKKSLVYDPSIYQQERQNSIRDYLLNHGMTEEEISANLIYGTDMSDDLKAAFRTGSEENILEVLRPLIQAGITFEDFQRIYDNRNLGLKNYKGRFKDELEKISSGKLVAPCNGTITSGFGYRKAPTRGASTYHKAIDIAGNTGDPIAAADGGEVVYAGWYGGYGYQVRIRHPNGTETRYSHLRGYNVKVGDIVRQGQNIAQMGSTGTSTGPHLDFQVKVQGRFVDPLKYING